MTAHIGDLFAPIHIQLPDLLVDSHAGKQVGHPLLDPYLADGFFIPQSIRRSWTRIIRIIPPPPIQRRGLRPASGHFQMAIGVNILYPFPGIPKPFFPVFQRLMRKPVDLVISPDPVKTTSPLARLPRPLADAIVIQLHQVRQVFTRPSTWSQTTLASAIETIRKAQLKGGLTPSGWSSEHLPYLVEIGRAHV